MTTRCCLCGGALYATSTPPDAALAIAALFDQTHSGEGHGPATARQAADARRREDEATNQSWMESR